MVRELKENGVHVTLEWLEECREHLVSQLKTPASGLHEAVYQQVLRADFTAAGSGGALPPGLGDLKEGVLAGPAVLQVNDLVDVANNYEERTAPPQGRAIPRGMFKLVLTDGRQQVNGFEFSRINELRNDSPKGIKVMVQNVRVERGVLVLTSNNTVVLGGDAAALSAVGAAATTSISALDNSPRHQKPKSMQGPASRSEGGRERADIDIEEGRVGGRGLAAAARESHDERNTPGTNNKGSNGGGVETDQSRRNRKGPSVLSSVRPVSSAQYVEAHQDDEHDFYRYFGGDGDEEGEVEGAGSTDGDETAAGAPRKTRIVVRGKETTGSSVPSTLHTSGSYSSDSHPNSRRQMRRTSPPSPRVRRNDEQEERSCSLKRQRRSTITSKPVPLPWSHMAELPSDGLSVSELRSKGAIRRTWQIKGVVTDLVGFKLKKKFCELRVFVEDGISSMYSKRVMIIAEPVVHGLFGGRDAASLLQMKKNKPADFDALLAKVALYFRKCEGLMTIRLEESQQDKGRHMFCISAICAPSTTSLLPVPSPRTDLEAILNYGKGALRRLRGSPSPQVSRRDSVTSHR